MISTICQYLAGGIAAILWLYIVARVVTRAIIRTLDNRRNQNGKAK